LTKTPYPPLWANHMILTMPPTVEVLRFWGCSEAVGTRPQSNFHLLTWAAIMQSTHIDKSEASAKCRGPLHPELLFTFKMESGYICWERRVRTYGSMSKRHKGQFCPNLWMPHRVRHDDEEIVPTPPGRVGGERVHPASLMLKQIVVAGGGGPPHGTGLRDALLGKNCILTA
jgi:hypothetical protein